MRKLAVLCVAMFGSLLLVSCGSDDAGSGGVPSSADMGSSAPAISPGLREQAPSPTGSAPGDTVARKEVVSGSVDITSGDPIGAASRVAEQVREVDGRIDSRTEQPGTDDTDPSATLTVRVPADRTDAFVDGLGGVGELTRVSINRDDVTMQWEDLDARIKALQASVDRLRALIATASTTADLIDAEEALGSRQGELDSLTAQQRRLDDQVALSTLTVSITAADNDSGGEGPGNFLDGVVAGWHSLIDWLQDAIVFVGKAIPWLGFLAVLAALGWSLRRLIRRRRPAAYGHTTRTENSASVSRAGDSGRAASESAESAGPRSAAEDKPETTGGSGAADRGAGDDQTEQP